MDASPLTITTTRDSATFCQVSKIFDQDISGQPAIAVNLHAETPRKVKLNICQNSDSGGMPQCHNVTGLITILNLQAS